MYHGLLRLLHVIGIMVVFFGLGGMLLLPRVSDNPPRGLKLLARLSHSIGLVVLLVTGVMMLSDLGLLAGEPPHWAETKFVLLVAMGAFVPVTQRKLGPAWAAALAFALLGAGAAYLGIFKPF